MRCLNDAIERVPSSIAKSLELKDEKVAISRQPSLIAGPLEVRILGRIQLTDFTILKNYV